MRRRKSGEDMRGSSVASAGWLFADLLLVLAMLFLAANTMGIHPPPPVVHVTPTPTPSPTPKILAQLDPKYVSVPISVSRAAFLKNDPAAIQLVEQTIFSHIPKGRSVGLVIAYGYSTPSEDCTVAYTVASNLYTLIHKLGRSNPVTFGNTASYSTLCVTQGDVNHIHVDMFLFTQAPA